jgi:ketosteroid isomerase-like protein
MEEAPSSKQIVKNAWKAFATRDPAQIAAVFTGDAEWRGPEGNATAKALEHTHEMLGRAAIVQFLSKEMHRLFVKDLTVTFTGLFSDGPVVILEQRLQATLPSGRAYDNDYCFIIELQNGCIHRVREYMDTQRGFRCIFG